MNIEAFFQKIRTYAPLSADAEQAWAGLLTERTIRKGEDFIALGQTPQKVAFVVSGLLYQYYPSEKGDSVIKYFFPEGRIAGSMPATLTKSESLFCDWGA